MVEIGRLVDQNSLRVLHVNFGIERGGIETWLVQLIRHFNPDRYRFALAYHRGRSMGMQAELCNLGVDLHQLPRPHSPLTFVAAFRHLLRTAGPFDVVHTHVNFPGMLMRAAAQEGIPIRIVQSHLSPELMTPGLSDTSDRRGLAAVVAGATWHCCSATCWDGFTTLHVTGSGPSGCFTKSITHNGR